jgi:hypothetical protein
MEINNLANGATLRVLLKNNEALANVIFNMREMIGMPKDKWTPEQKQWWSKANIVLGQVISDINHGK